MNIGQFVGQAMTLPILQQQAIALCMLQNVENHFSNNPEKKEEFPLLPPQVRLLQVATSSNFKPGRAVRGKQTIQDAVVELVSNCPGLRRREVSSKVSEKIGCTYKQAYVAISSTYMAGKTITKNAGIYLAKGQKNK